MIDLTEIIEIRAQTLLHVLKAHPFAITSVDGLRVLDPIANWLPGYLQECVDLVVADGRLTQTATGQFVVTDGSVAA